jgi:hypothetical protein
MNDLQALLMHLKQPEYIHVLINPLPLYGMAAGAFMLVMSWILKSPKEQKSALLWIVLMGIATWCVVRYGMKGYDRVLAMSSSEDAQQWLKVHKSRAEMSMYVFYLTGFTALLALMMPSTKEKLSKILVGVTLALTFICLGLGGWISQAGGRVRHSEFREGPHSPDQLPK